MLHHIIGFGIIALVYLCFVIVIFAPTIYAAWLYLVTRKISVKRKSITKLLVYVFAINLIIAYFLVHFAFDYFLRTKNRGKREFRNFHHNKRGSFSAKIFR